MEKFNNKDFAEQILKSLSKVNKALDKFNELSYNLGYSVKERKCIFQTNDLVKAIAFQAFILKNKSDDDFKEKRK